jgi:hypothetical protein
VQTSENVRKCPEMSAAAQVAVERLERGQKSLPIRSDMNAEQLVGDVARGHMAPLRLRAEIRTGVPLDTMTPVGLWLEKRLRLDWVECRGRRECAVESLDVLGTFFRVEVSGGRGEP